MENGGDGFGRVVIRMTTLFLFVRGFIRFGLLETEGVPERTRESVPDGPDPSGDRDEGCTEKDNQRGWKDASP